VDTAHLLIVFFAAFTAMLAFGAVLLLCDALKKNNEHVRTVLGQLGSWKDAGIKGPNRTDEPHPSEPKSDPGISPPPVARFRAKRLEAELTQAVAEPAADGTLAYIHPKSTPVAKRPIVVRDVPANIPIEARQPVYIDSLAKEAAFTGVVVAIGLTEPDGDLETSVEELVRKVTNDGSLGSVLPDHEFILAYSSGDRATRRMDELTEDLWKLQLRSLRVSPALLAWGMVEVIDQPLSDAVESACESMQEARRTCKIAACLGGRRAPAVYISILGRLLALRNSNKLRSTHHPELTVLFDTGFPDDETNPARGK
jgi:hypothetical protein